jgi:hypothetical protein
MKKLLVLILLSISLSGMAQHDTLWVKGVDSFLNEILASDAYQVKRFDSIAIAPPFDSTKYTSISYYRKSTNRLVYRVATTVYGQNGTYEFHVLAIDGKVSKFSMRSVIPGTPPDVLDFDIYFKGEECNYIVQRHAKPVSLVCSIYWEVANDLLAEK